MVSGFDVLLLVLFSILFVATLKEEKKRRRSSVTSNFAAERRRSSALSNSVVGNIDTLKEFHGPRALPIIGHALQWIWIGTTRNLYDTIHEFCKRYGSACGLWVGNQYFVFIEDPVIGREILNQEDLHRKFPATSITYELYGHYNLGISQAHGDVLKEMRRFASRGLKRFGFGKFASMDDIVRQELMKFLKAFETSRQDGNGVVSMDEAFYVPTLNVLWKLMTGEAFTPHDSRLINLIGLARKVLKTDPPGGSLPFAFTFLTYIPGLTIFQDAKKFWDEIRALLGEIVVKRRANGHFVRDPECFIDLFLHEIEVGEDPMYTDAQAIQTCMDLFLAGLDSTANTLDWMIIYLVSYPTVYAKVVAEIEEVIGYEQLPTVQHKARMPYTESVMLEVMRIANVITYTMRAPLYETTFQDYKIPEDTHILVKLDCFHKSKEIWGDPEIFRPERFLDSKMNIINADKIFTFGFGKRACIGEISSKLSIFLFLTTFLQNYFLEVSPHHPAPSLLPERGILISHPTAYYVKATPNPKNNN